MKKKILIPFILISLIFLGKSYSSDNYYNFDYSKQDLLKIEKKWEYNSGVLKDTQNKILQYENKLIHLDGYKNLIVLSLSDGKEICKNIGKKDRAPFRGISLYKSKNGIYAVFIRQDILQLINIKNCKQYNLKKKIKVKSVVSRILIHGTKAIILPNGGSPQAYNLENGKLIWKVSIPENIKKNLKKYNLDKEFYWDVWGGGTLDLKYNQVIFSTANAKPSFVSKNRLGPNLFYNSVVSINIENGKYNWHFQEIEHDVLNLDLASPPVLYNSFNGDIVIQASKTGQLILLDRKTGEPLENFREDVYYHDKEKKIFTKFKKFEDWLHFSRMHFQKDDINRLNLKYKKEAQEIIKKSTISDYKRLEIEKNYIHYGMHGGSEWPGIGLDGKGNVIIPASNIAWISKLKDPLNFDLKFHVKEIFLATIKLLTLDFAKFKQNAKKIILNAKKITNFKELDIEKYKRFESSDGIPLNSPPWGTLTMINLQEKEIKWQVPHGKYNQIKEKNNRTGSEVFGCPVIAGQEVIFVSGTRDKTIYAYDLKNGNTLWEDKLPYISYGCPIIASYKGSHYLIIDSSGGRKFRKENYGDAIIAYKLK